MFHRSHKGKDRGDKYKDSFSEGLKRDDDKSSSDSEWVNTMFYFVWF